MWTLELHVAVYCQEFAITVCTVLEQDVMNLVSIDVTFQSISGL
jgi:hypothetical protein